MHRPLRPTDRHNQIPKSHHLERTPHSSWPLDHLLYSSPNPSSTQCRFPITRLSDHLAFLHAACFSPTPSTWIQAVRNNHFLSWPGVTVQNIRKHLPESAATAKGHLDQLRKNVQTTQTAPTTADPDASKRTHAIFATTWHIPSSTGQIHSDLTGRFPVTSVQGHKYILILYDHDSNAILAEPLKSRSDTHVLQAYDKLISLLKSRGLTPCLHRLDNEASNALKTRLQDHGITFQLAPPHIHRRNAAERAIRTFKNHFLAGLASTDPHFPLYLWSALIPQATITLNLLRQSRINPNLSAYAQIWGQFDFNRTPLVPPGTKLILHEKPSQRTTWSALGMLVKPSTITAAIPFMSQKHAVSEPSTPSNFFPLAFPCPQPCLSISSNEQLPI